LLISFTVKVLYTFDDQNKTNCLARLPNALSIPVISLDDATHIGVIELKTCIQAIISASPEMIHKLEQDYTVYAYDYSEYETPLVGQGMLSRVLASASPTPNAPASQSGTMITGRVCKNILGIYANGLRDTLEVKLKLVPVPTRFQNEYEQTMNSYRSSSHTSLMNSNPFSMDPQQQQQGLSGQSNRGSADFDSLQNMLTPQFAGSPENFDDSISQQQSRPGSATPSVVSMHMTGQNYDGSRPASRASFRANQDQSFNQIQHQSIDTQDPFNDDIAGEEGPARKRARLTQTNWQGKTSFGGRVDSLRVAASTAASIRGFRSSIDNSAISQDMLPRVPTPRPSDKVRKSSVTLPSALRRASFTDNNSFTPMSDDDAYSLAPSSPEIPSSPPVSFAQDDYIPPPSSPLPEFVMHTDSGFQSDLPTDIPQSDLPAVKPQEKSREDKWRESMARREWTAYKPPTDQPQPPSQTFVNLTSSNKARSAVRVPRSPKPKKTRRKDMPVAERPEDFTPFEGRFTDSQMDESDNLPGTENMHHSSLQFPNLQPSRRQSTFGDYSNAPSPVPEPTNPARLPHIDGPEQTMVLPEQVQGPVSEPVVLPKRNPLSKQGKKLPRARPLPRASTWAYPSSDIDGFNLESESNVLPTIEQRSVATPEPQAFDFDAKPRSGSGAVRKRTITDQLQQAIVSGHPPKFCMNCGNVSPPTWRPYWIRVEYGTGEEVTTGKETGIHCIEPVSKDGTGKVLTYRIYKQWANLTTQEKESQMFEQLILCNSCGDFFKKRKFHRPENMWDKDAPKPSKGRKRKAKVGQEPTTDQLDPLVFENQLENALRRVVTVDQNDQSLEPANAVDANTHGIQPNARATNNFIKRSNSSASDTVSSNSTRPSQLSRTTSVNDASSAQVMGPPALPNSTSESSWQDQNAFAALQRAIQQSPARKAAVGSKNSPIEVDPEASPDTVRRNLFPSPRKDGEFRGLDDMDTKTTPTGSSSRAQKQANFPLDSSPCPAPTVVNTSSKTPPPPIDDENAVVNAVLVTDIDKENCPPPEDEYTRQLDADLQDLIKTPKKSTSRDPLADNLFATPTRHQSGGGIPQSSPLPMGPTGLTPINDFSQFLNGDTWSPSKLTLSPNWLRNLRTPGRTNNTGGHGNTDFQFGDDFFANLSSDMPLSSSPGLGAGAFGSWEFYEDGTATLTGSGSLTGSQEGDDKSKSINDKEQATGT
jgi:hypothetical protein